MLKTFPGDDPEPSLTQGDSISPPYSLVSPPPEISFSLHHCPNLNNRVLIYRKLVLAASGEAQKDVRGRWEC